jgi:hypothetical protein
MHNLFAGAANGSLRITNPSASLTAHAVRWLLESGIQQPGGSVARYYRVDTRVSQPVSTEITGYAAASLAYLHRLTGAAACLDSALRAGRYLVHQAWDAGLGVMPFECPEDASPQRGLAYFFDTGIIARGLAALWRVSGEAEFLQAARACARSMANDFRGPAGYHPVLSLPDKQAVRGDGRWSREPGCYQLKSAMAWLELGEERYTNDYEKLLAGFLTTHEAFLDVEQNRERVMDRLHAYCYFLEGLLPRAARPDCALALRGGISRVARLLREIGPVFERSDVYAQLLRLRLYAAAMECCPIEEAAAEQEAAKIRSFQLDDPDPRVHGSFCFGRKAGALMPFANPVSTAFCVQALAMWEQYRAGEFRPDPIDLI